MHEEALLDECARQLAQLAVHLEVEAGSLPLVGQRPGQRPERGAAGTVADNGRAAVRERQRDVAPAREPALDASHGQAGHGAVLVLGAPGVDPVAVLVAQQLQPARMVKGECARTSLEERRPGGIGDRVEPPDAH